MLQNRRITKILGNALKQIQIKDKPEFEVKDEFSGSIDDLTKPDDGTNDKNDEPSGPFSYVPRNKPKGP